jgi:hypothetical protein
VKGERIEKGPLQRAQINEDKIEYQKDIASSHKPVKPIEEVLREKHNHDCMVEALVSLQGEQLNTLPPRRAKPRHTTCFRSIIAFWA